MVKEVYRIEKRFTFEASHKLPRHDGKCARMHGHSWAMVVVVEGTRLVNFGPKEDMLVDYGDVSALTRVLIEDYLDHYHLNESTGLKNPTSEALARWVYMRLEPRVRTLREGEALRLHSIRIEETCTSACTFELKEEVEATPRPPWVNGTTKGVLRSPGDKSTTKTRR